MLPYLGLLSFRSLRVLPNRLILTLGRSKYILLELALASNSVGFVEVSLEIGLLGSINIMHKLLSKILILPSLLPLISSIVIICLTLAPLTVIAIIHVGFLLRVSG
jgi:hypothetical protein